jgi:hypothetical protein
VLSSGSTITTEIMEDNSWQYLAAAPATGAWRVGHKVWFTAPAAGGAPGAVCTTAGTPGTWKNMANLAA